MARKSWNVVDFELKLPDIDYSEIITEPGLVLSMREIYERYAAMGVDLLHNGNELVLDNDELDDDMYDPEVDDNIDILAHASVMRSGATEELRRKKRLSARTKDEAPKEPDQEDEKPKEKPKQSEGDE